MVGSGVSGATRLVLLGDGAWATGTLQRLAADGYRVVAVLGRRSPTERGLGNTARTLGIPVLRPANVNAPEAVAQLAQLAPDLMVSVAYDQILGRDVLALPSLGTVNVHAGALPRYRGRNVINWAILNGEREVGLTVHLVDEGIDSGDILVQRMLPVGWTEGYGHVLSRVVAAVPDITAEAVAQLVAGQAVRVPQDPAAAFYVGAREDGDEWIDWSASSERLHNLVRAITRPAPGARTLLGATPVIVWRAHYDPAWPAYLATPGQVVGRRDDGVVVKTGDSTLLVHEVQVGDGRAEIPRWRIGTRLGVNPVAHARTLAARLAALEGPPSAWRPPV